MLKAAALEFPQESISREQIYRLSQHNSTAVM